jgi:hypothetical protein
MTEPVLKRVKSNVKLFAKTADAFQLKYDRKIKAYVSDGMITIDDGDSKPVVAKRDIPITRNGSISCNVRIAWLQQQRFTH